MPKSPNPASFADGPRTADVIKAALVGRVIGHAKDEAAAALNAAEARADMIGDEMSALYDRMLALKPTILEGYRAFALAIVHACWSDEITPKRDTADWHGIKAIFSGLVEADHP